MKETGMLKRLLALALVLIAVLTASAALATETIPAGNYGKTTIDKVFFRKTADTNGDYWALLPLGWELKVLGTKTAGKILWYKVQGGTPSAPGRTYTGYIHSGYFAASDGSTAASQAASKAVSTSTSGTSVLGYVRTVKSGVNIRKTPDGTVLTAKDEYKIPYNTVLAYTDGPRSAAGYNWVKISYKGIVGYIRSDCWTQTNSSGKAIAGGITPQPAVVVPENTEALGTINLTTGGVNFRMAPNGAIIGRLNKNTKMNYYGTQIVKGNELWYLAYSNDLTSYGFVLGSLAKVISGATVIPVVTPTPTPSSGNASSASTAASGTLVTTADKLNLRKTPSLQAAVLVQIPKAGVRLSFTESKIVGGISWYKVKYSNKTGWLHGSFVRIISSASSGTTTNTNTGASAVTTTVPDPSLFSEVAFTTANKVFIRKEPSMSGKQLTSIYKSGTKLTYNGKYQKDTTSKPGTTYTWYNVTSGSVTGWMRGEYIRILTQEEKKVYLLTGNMNAPLEASYTTLSKGSEGDAVKRLQQALANLGYLAASDVTGTYTTATEKAVLAFQKARGLTQDGIAGEKTQHALFNTVPKGTYDNSTVNATLYPVEKVDWYNGDIQTVWANNSTAVITDVYTGISFRAYRIYGGNHADAVPLTAEDTVAYCQIYGTSNAQEIADRDSTMQNWRRRPLWVTVGNRTFAASMYGVPHNFTDSVVKNANSKLNNNFVGQFCVHFVNSKTHDSSSSPAHVDYDSAKNGNFGHQSAIQYAYTHSISGTK